MLIKVVIDRDGCISCGACWERCPDFFEQSPDDDFSQIVKKYRTGGLGEGESPANQAGCVREASENCPVEVIHIS